jgi:HSP20 family protein
LSRNSGDPFSSLQKEINQLFEGFFDDGPTKAFGDKGLTSVPKLDISETDNEVHVTVDLPGMKEDDIEVEFTGDSLRIHGEKKDERDEKRHNFHRIERTFGMFERVVPIPVEVDREKVQATFKNGVLNVTMPKAVTAPVSQKICVKPGN